MTLQTFDFIYSFFFSPHFFDYTYTKLYPAKTEVLFMNSFVADYSVVPTLPSDLELPDGERKIYQHPVNLKGNVVIALNRIRLIKIQPGKDFNGLLRIINGSLDQGRYLDQIAAERFVELVNGGDVEDISLVDDYVVPNGSDLFWLGTIHSVNGFNLIPVTRKRDGRYIIRFHISTNRITENSYIVIERPA